jgi:hypothetical protein
MTTSTAICQSATRNPRRISRPHQMLLWKKISDTPRGNVADASNHLFGGAAAVELLVDMSSPWFFGRVV